MAFLASGEDPNYGRYAVPIRRAICSIIRQQDAKTGYFPNSMYHHGFGMLALSEAYGMVDESLLWQGEKPVRSIAQALDLAIRCAATAQKKNRWGGWRYSPDATDADTSVTGAVLMGIARQHETPMHGRFGRDSEQRPWISSAAARGRTAPWPTRAVSAAWEAR